MEFTDILMDFRRFQTEKDRQEISEDLPKSSEGFQRSPDFEDRRVRPVNKYKPYYSEDCRDNSRSLDVFDQLLPSIAMSQTQIISSFLIKLRKLSSHPSFRGKGMFGVLTLKSKRKRRKEVVVFRLMQ